jgi:hypothetical protein
MLRKMKRLYDQHRGLILYPMLIARIVIYSIGA